MPVTTQPRMIAPGPAPLDMSFGRLNTPPPIIEPTTRATSGSNVSLFDASVAGELVPGATDALDMASPPLSDYGPCGRLRAAFRPTFGPHRHPRTVSLS